MADELTLIKQYCRVDYDDDDELIALMRDAASEELAGLIPGFDPSASPRQRILWLTVIKSLYDSRERDDTARGGRSGMREAVRSMLLSLTLEGME